MMTYDSLNRHMLLPYGCGRLARQAITFDTCYVGSMPCMPARRELDTDRTNFLHRS